MILELGNSKPGFAAADPNISECLRLLMSASDKDSCEIRAILAGKFEKRPSHFVFARNFGTVKNGAFREVCTEQMRQILRAALVPHRHSDTDGLVGDSFKDVFIYQNCSFSYIHAGSYI